MAEHARLSASAAHRWTQCPGSIRACEALNIKETQSDAASQGSFFHALAYQALEAGADADVYLNQTTPWGEKITQQDVDHLNEYVHFVYSMKGKRFLEERVDFSEWVPEGFGTADAIVLSGQDVHIIDLKWGKGVKVYAKENPQAQLYALGVFSRFEYTEDIQNIHVHIVQPRIGHIDSWVLSVHDLLAFGEWVSERAQEALQPNAKRSPSESACRFCAAACECRTLKKHIESVICSEFDSLDLKEVESLGKKDLAKVLENRNLILSWLNAVEDYVTQTLLDGGEFPGFKLVEGRSIRQWGNEKYAQGVLEQALGDDAYEKKLLSVAKAEKALGKKRIELIKDLIVKPQGKPTLAPESDPRQSVAITANDFENLNS